MTEERAKELAIKILADTRLYGKDYYKVEDNIIQILLGEEPEPLDYDIFSYHNTIRAEVDNWTKSEYGVSLEDEEIEEIVQSICNHVSEPALNLNFIQSVINRYMLERKMVIEGQQLDLEDCLNGRR